MLASHFSDIEETIKYLSTPQEDWCPRISAEDDATKEKQNASSFDFRLSLRNSWIEEIERMADDKRSYFRRKLSSPLLPDRGESNNKNNEDDSTNRRKQFEDIERIEALERRERARLGLKVSGVFQKFTSALGKGDKSEENTHSEAKTGSCPDRNNGCKEIKKSKRRTRRKSRREQRRERKNKKEGRADEKGTLKISGEQDHEEKPRIDQLDTNSAFQRARDVEAKQENNLRELNLLIQRLERLEDAGREGEAAAKRRHCEEISSKTKLHSSVSQSSHENSPHNCTTSIRPVSSSSGAVLTKSCINFDILSHASGDVLTHRRGATPSTEILNGHSSPAGKVKETGGQACITPTSVYTTEAKSRLLLYELKHNCLLRALREKKDFRYLASFAADVQVFHVFLFSLILNSNCLTAEWCVGNGISANKHS